MNNPFVHIAEGEFTMKKLHKKFEPKAFDLAAYYTCMCNYLPCPCPYSAEGKDTEGEQQGTFLDIEHIEDVSWNN